MDVVVGEDGLARCAWGASSPEYVAYHDHEWGVGTTDDHRLFEKLCLEGFQSGLSWLTILRKRENFRAAFADFDKVWSALSSREQARILALLVARVEFDPAESTIAVTFHPSAIKTFAEGNKENVA